MSIKCIIIFKLYSFIYNFHPPPFHLSEVATTKLYRQFKFQPKHSPEIEQQGAEAFCVPLRVSFKILDLRRLSLGSADPSEYSRS